MTKLLNLTILTVCVHMFLTEYFSDIKINYVNQTLTSSFVSQQAF
jgi:hypothetical protein